MYHLQVPSTRIFNDYCATVVSRYHLDNAVTAASVVDLYTEDTEEYGRICCAVCDDGTTVRAHAAVVAVGSLTTPRVPDWAQDWLPKSTPDRLVHATTLMTQDPAKWVSPKDKRLLIVGGGLTAGHLGVRACREGRLQEDTIACARHADNC
eukprot:TRINITY_DN6974_c0_g1_i2.p3 TRINITY_DN6974_c0_g1~~TRINITY_DN6974_c0_g1_i2.p3  ORF type:complete len:151 (+),score=9.19 TRINITY_DN6974_c0_g1_i2:573-1025(+)